MTPRDDLSTRRESLLTDRALNREVHMGRVMTTAIIIGVILAVLALDVFGLGWVLRKAWRNVTLRIRR